MLDYMHNVPEGFVDKLKGNLQRNEDIVQQLRESNRLLRKRDLKKREVEAELVRIQRGLEQLTCVPTPTALPACLKSPKLLDAGEESGETLATRKTKADVHTEQQPPLCTPVKSQKSKWCPPEGATCSQGSFAAAARAARAAQLQKATELQQAETRVAPVIAGSASVEEPSRSFAEHKKYPSWAPELATPVARRLEPLDLPRKKSQIAERLEPLDLSKNKSQIAELEDAIRTANEKRKRKDAERRALALEAMKEIEAVRRTIMSCDVPAAAG